MDRHGDTLVLDVAQIDCEHRKLADLFEQFAEAIKDRRSPDRAQTIVREALAVANEHFEHEEALMEQTNYPEIEDERFHHRNLRLQMTTLVSDALSMAGGGQIVLDSLARMQRLLVEHISGPDRDLANYLHARNMH